MKVMFNRKPVDGPWGGGNKVLKSITDKLIDSGHSVVYDLQDNIDVIFCFDPRVNNHGLRYVDLLNYKNNFKTKIIQRVGDAGTHGKPELTSLVKETINFSDHIIFASDWAREYVEYDKKNFTIIQNAPLDIFYKHRNNKLPKDKIKIVTHHWSTNPKKGFQYYKFIDEVCWKNIDFTYIGRLPKKFEFKNSKYIPATGDNSQISKILGNKDIYLTASEEEAGANHVLEAMAAGLPVVYHNNGGSINEYCCDYGLSFFDQKSMINSIVAVANNHQEFKNKAMSYNNNMEKTTSKYLEVILNYV